MLLLSYRVVSILENARNGCVEMCRYLGGGGL